MLVKTFYRFCRFLRYPSMLGMALGVVCLMPYEAKAECSAEVPLTDLETVISEAEAALSRLDVASFKGLVEGAEAMIPCVDSTIPPRVSAALHRLIGIRAVGNRDPLAARAFAAARWIEPNYKFSRSLIPEGNPIRRVYEEAPWQDRAADAIDRPESGAIYVDGAPSTDRAISWPAVVQWVDGTEDVRFTEYVLPGNPLPNYPVWVPPEIETRKAPPALIALSIGSGLASGALYGVATLQEGRYKDTSSDPVPDAQLDDLRRSTNTLVVASAVTGTAAVGTGVALIVAW